MVQHLSNCEECNQFLSGNRYTFYRSDGHIAYVCYTCIKLLNPPIKSKNSTCRDTGHDFMGTTANNYRKCCRSQCVAVQRFQGGVWIDVKEEATRKRRTEAVSMDLWGVL